MTWVLLKRERVTEDPGVPSFHGHVIVATFARNREAELWQGVEPRRTFLVEVPDDAGKRINATLRTAAQ